MSGRPAIPTGGPGVPPLVAVSGVGYGDAVDHEGNTAMHNAAARGDVEMILHLVASARLH